MALTPITADSQEGRILLGLRAGAMDGFACRQRFPYFRHLIGRLVRAGLVEGGNDSYRLTAAGRAACPFRNPKATPPAAAPVKEIQPMPATTGLTAARVLERIIAAGSAGISPKALAAEFGVTDGAIYYHVKGMGAAGFKKRGLLVAAGFVKPEIPAEVAAEAEKIAQEYAEMIDFEIDPAPPEAPAETTAERVARRARDLPEYIDIDDPDQVEIAVFSSGGMDIYFDDNTITLSAPVLAKLRAFLGRFAEAA